MTCKFCGRLIPTLEDPYPKPVVFCDDDCLDEYAQDVEDAINGGLESLEEEGR